MVNHIKGKFDSHMWHDHITSSHNKVIVLASAFVICDLSISGPQRYGTKQGIPLTVPLTLWETANGCQAVTKELTWSWERPANTPRDQSTSWPQIGNYHLGPSFPLRHPLLRCIYDPGEPVRYFIRTVLSFTIFVQLSPARFFEVRGGKSDITLGSAQSSLYVV